MNVTPLLFLAGSAAALVGSAVRVVAEHDRRVESERYDYPLGARGAPPSAQAAGTPERALLTPPRRAVPQQRSAAASALAG